MFLKAAQYSQKLKQKPFHNALECDWLRLIPREPDSWKSFFGKKRVQKSTLPKNTSHKIVSTRKLVFWNRFSIEYSFEFFQAHSGFQIPAHTTHSKTTMKTTTTTMTATMKKKVVTFTTETTKAMIVIIFLVEIMFGAICVDWNMPETISIACDTSFLKALCSWMHLS